MVFVSKVVIIADDAHERVSDIFEEFHPIIYENTMVAIALRLAPSKKLRSAPTPVREQYVQHWLGVFAMKAPEFITTHINQTHPFQSRTGWAATKWKGEVTGRNRVRITSLVSYTQWLNNGVHPHQMTYLLNAKRAIPIQTTGGLIFRRPSVQSMLAGGWRHPGYKGTHFFEQSIEKLTKFMAQTYQDLVIERMEMS